MSYFKKLLSLSSLTVPFAVTEIRSFQASAEAVSRKGVRAGTGRDTDRRKGNGRLAEAHPGSKDRQESRRCLGRLPRSSLASLPSGRSQSKVRKTQMRLEYAANPHSCHRKAPLGRR